MACEALLGFNEAFRLATNGLILMPDFDKYLGEIDLARMRRVKELSEVKRHFGARVGGEGAGVFSKAVAVLAYAVWEGFYNDCARVYVDFLRASGKKVRDIEWMLLSGVFERDFSMLRGKEHSSRAKREFITNLRKRLDCSFEEFEPTTIMARSNLDFRRISENYEVMNFDLSSLQAVRNRLDKELVAWRHAVAHGDSPDLSELDIANHIDFVSDLLTRISQAFQEAVVRHS